MSSSPDTVAGGKVVSLHYILTDDDGEVLDSSRDAEPLAYLHGGDNIVPGLEREIEGKTVGSKLQVVVAPEDGYGPREEVESQAIPRSAFEGEVPADIEAGMPLAAEGPDGEMVALWVTKVDDESVYVDPNHPLAGMTLHFDVEVMAVRDASDEEKEHGHPHGPGGHAHE